MTQQLRETQRVSSLISAGDRHGVTWVRGASFRLEGTIGLWRRTGSPVQYATTNDVPVDDSKHAATGWVQLADVTLSLEERRWRPGKGDHEVRLAELRMVCLTRAIYPPTSSPDSDSGSSEREWSNAYRGHQRF